MKNRFKDKTTKTLLLSLSSALLGLSLSVFAITAFATDEPTTAVEKSAEVTMPSATEETQPTSSTEPIGGADAGKPSEVTSATPPMSDFKFTGVHSLRGGIGLDDANEAADIKLLPSDRPPIARNYFQQPPLIPHRVREYKITVRNNKCMSCHSWTNYKKARATKISQTHFADRDGNAQSTLAARRYFCNQCHVPQTDAKPLIENGFEPVSDLNK